MTVEQIEEALREALPHVEINDVELCVMTYVRFRTPTSSCSVPYHPVIDTPESIAYKVATGMSEEVPDAPQA